MALVGGDTTRGPLTVSVQILGHVPHGTALRRSGARAGDLLAVSGTLGDAGAGLKFSSMPPAAVARRDVEELIRRFDYPCARVQLGKSARGIATAAMDLSDGLVGDLPKLAQASGLAAHVDRSSGCRCRPPCGRRQIRYKRATGRWPRATITNCCSPCRRSAMRNCRRRRID